MSQDGALKVQRKQCRTCIYSKRSPSRRTVAQLEGEITDPHLPWFFKGYRVCHHSSDAVCAGFWRRHRDHFALGQIAQRLKFVRYVQEDVLVKEVE